jgi:hypothetical protein
MKNKKIKSKGQAALEFMMTYGWAMLLLTAMVAGLVYVMPHPKTVIANKCLFGSGIPCMGSQLSSNNLTVVLRNGMGQSIYNLSANVTMPKEMACSLSSTTLRAEERLVIVCNNTILGVQDDARVRIALTYKKIKEGYDQIIIGELYAKYN